MLIRNECKALAELIKDRVIYFDHKSYDEEDLIPHFNFIAGDKSIRLNILSAQFDSADAHFLLLTTSNPLVESIKVDINNTNMSEAELNSQLCLTNVDGIIRDMYYELSESHEIGDFELDFLKDRLYYLLVIKTHCKADNTTKIRYELFKNEVNAIVYRRREEFAFSETMSEMGYSVSKKSDKLIESTISTLEIDLIVTTTND